MQRAPVYYNEKGTHGTRKMKSQTSNGNMAGKAGLRDTVVTGFLGSTVLLVLLCGGDAFSTMPVARSAKEIVGRLEMARICPEGIELRGKMDTGAKNSSLHAPEIVEFTKEGKPWVRFKVTNRAGEHASIERKVVRIATIKQHGGESLRRPVICLGLCVGKVCREVEVNLEDRSRFLFPLLIGRSFMEGRILIDPALKNTVKPAACKESPAN